MSLRKLFRTPSKRADMPSIRKVEVPHGLATKCPSCEEVILNQPLEENLGVCPKCGFHFQVSARTRIDQLFEEFQEVDAALEATDILSFPGYAERVQKERVAKGCSDAAICGLAKLDGIPVAAGVMDFSFLGGSMGVVVGEKLTRITELALEKKCPLVIVSASGGARMHEGAFSLMQMAKISGALALLGEARLPYLSVLTHPTTGGVSASFATLGDLIVAEPGAMIGFAGPRVIKETTHQDLPPGFQTSEFLIQHGLLDLIVPRRELRDRLAACLRAMGFGQGG